jgi:predicted GNAT family acetyltransferase
MVTVENNEDRSRYEIQVDGRLAGSAWYRRRPDAVEFTHTEIEPEYEGQGLGGKLAAAALDDVRAAGGRVIATCPFIRGYIERHPAYADLLATVRGGS